MRALLLKDFIVITKQLKIFLIIIIIMSLSGGEFMAGYAIFIGASLPMTAIAYDERSKWNEIASMMPYAKRDIVISKYMLGYMCIMGSCILAIASRLFMLVIGIEKVALSYSSILLSVSGGIIFSAITIPLLFKFGTEKGRIIYMILMGLLFGIGSLLKTIDGNTLIAISESTIPIILLISAVIINVLSIQFTMRFSLSR